ncbi:MAG TPA: NAD-binding protein, partial [Vicinamibacterales bacterium]|nr:NAD-binding protein [Vicinamibacterales bacterium]
LAGNFTIAAMLETLGEAFAFIRKSGVSPALFLQILNGALYKSPIYGNYGQLIADGRFEPAGFALRLGLKDVRLALEAAEAVAAPMPLASLLRDRLLTQVARGRGSADWSAIAEVSARDAGL